MQTQLKWLTTLQAIEDRLRVLQGRRRTRRCLEEIQSLQKQRSRVKQRIDPALLRRFEILLERRQGKAIVPIRGNSCGACGLVLPAQTVVDVQTREFIITCESCTRFLYWDRGEVKKKRKAKKEKAVAAKSTTKKKTTRKKATATKRKTASRAGPSQKPIPARRKPADRSTARAKSKSAKTKTPRSRQACATQSSQA